MTHTIEGASRAQIAHFLPDAIAAALRSYQTFSEREVTGEPKDFKDHHTACKVAIAHVELLLKLARFVDVPGANANDAAILSVMMQEAEETLRHYNTGEEDDE